LRGRFVPAIGIAAVVFVASLGPQASAQSEPSPTPSASSMPSASPSASPEPSVSPTPTPTPTPTEPPDPVQATVRVSLTDVDLFGLAKISGRVQPSRLDVRPKISLRRNGKVIKSFSVPLRNGGYFRKKIRIKAPGSYRVRAVVAGKGVVRTSDLTTLRATESPALSIGARGDAVRRLEKRLKGLGYYIPAIDQRFTVETSDALIAFNKVQRTARVGYATADTWSRLAFPKRPQPRFKSKWHFEIDQTRQVIFVVKRSKVKWILHTSTGANGATHDGSYTVHRKLAGYSPGRLYYPSYWDGLRAFHGWPEVPTYNASHGCARVPMWAAQWMYGLAQIGDRVHVYH
jgi:N-acetylmuramoyl-L-alanine amidase